MSLPSCLFRPGGTQEEEDEEEEQEDLLNLPYSSCYSNPGSSNLFQLRAQTAMDVQSSFAASNTAAALCARMLHNMGKRT